MINNPEPDLFRFFLVLNSSRSTPVSGKEKAIEKWKKKHNDETGEESLGLCVKDRMHGYKNDDTFVARGRERNVYTIGS